MSQEGETSSEMTEQHTIPVIPIKVWPSYPHNLLEYNPSQPGVEAYALLDTGADICYVDSTFAVDVGLPAVRNTEVSGATSTIKTTVMNSTIEFSRVDERFGVELSSIPLRDNGRVYHIVFGMSLIKMGILTLDFKNKIYTLTFRN